VHQHHREASTCWSSELLALRLLPSRRLLARPSIYTHLSIDVVRYFRSNSDTLLQVRLSVSCSANSCHNPKETEQNTMKT
jgi:hypothetical protein